MRHGRAKAARKTLQFFERTIGLQSPYHVLVDGTFLVAAMTYKIPLIERIERLLQHGSSFTLYCTDETLHELQMLYQKLTTKTTTTMKASKRSHSDSKNNDSDKIEAFQNAIDFIKEYCQIIHRSTKKDATKTPSASTEKIENQNKTGSLDKTFIEQCSTTFDMRSSSITKLSAAALDMLKLATEPAMISLTPDSATAATTATNDINEKETAETNNKKRHKPHRYLCASQDEELLDLLRQTGQVPIIRLARGSVLLLEQPSIYAQGNAVRDEKQKWNSSSIICSKEKQYVDLVKQHERDTIRSTNAEQIAKKRKVESELYGGPKVLTEYDRRQKKKKKRSGTSEPNPLSCKKKKKAP